MRVVRKSCACLIRTGVDGAEVLVFDHPVAGTQLPKGTVEVDEQPDAAVVRELAEETGVTATVTRWLGEWRRVTGPGPDETGASEEHVWSVFELRPTSDLPDAWDHSATGSHVEDGLLFRCRWLPVARAADSLHPLFHPVAAILVESQASAG